MTRNSKPAAPVPVATRDEVDAWYRQGLLDPSQYTALVDVDVDVDAEAEAGA